MTEKACQIAVLTCIVTCFLFQVNLSIMQKSKYSFFHFGVIETIRINHVNSGKKKLGPEFFYYFFNREEP